MQYIINTIGITLFVNNRPVRVEKGSDKYAKIISALDLPLEQQDVTINNILNGQEAVQRMVSAGFTITDTNVSFRGENLPQVLATKVRNMSNEGVPLTLFEKFWENLHLNPSFTSIRELYSFLEYKELPLTEDGCFLAYRGLRDDYYSVHGNLDTVVLRGTVDSTGHIYNGVGEIIEIERSNVDDNRSVGCSQGLHVGSLNYAQVWSQGKTVVVKINPKDVVSVPSDYNCQKCRVCAYEVVSEFVNEIVASVVSEDLTPVPSESIKEYDKFTTRVKNYLKKNEEHGVDIVTVRRIQNSFSPNHPSKERVLDALNTLGYVFTEDEGTFYVQLNQGK